MNPYQVLERCRATNSSKEKVKILKKYDSELLRYVIENAVSPFVTFGVKQYQFGEPTDQNDFEYNMPVLKFVLAKLNSRGLTGDRAQEAIRETSCNLNKEQQNILGCILNKDLRAGVNVKTANKAFPGLIPEFNVQLANTDISRINYPCYAEVKYNGRRNLAIVTGREVQHFSRNGKEHLNYGCFDSELIEIAKGLPTVFDGEVIGEGNQLDGYKKSQQQARRKYNVDTSEQILIIFDVLALGDFKRQICSAIYQKRLVNLRNMFNMFRNETQLEKLQVRLGKGKIVNSKNELDLYYEKIIKAGNEGLIVKNFNGLYEYKRSHNWVKLKQEETKDLKIVDVKEGLKGRKDTLGSVIVRHKKVKVNCPLGKGISFDDAKQMWKHRKKLIGQIAEIKFQNVTADNSLFLPKFVCVRDDKDEADK